jgi:glycosyltransferase involved in cell wall biosynthesis
MSKIRNAESMISIWQIPDNKIVFWRGRSRDWVVVIPVINEGKRLHDFLLRMRSAHIHEIADVLIVDGGSTDGSVNENVLSQMNVSGLILKTGAGGLSAQLRCAYAHALEQGYRGIVTIDGNNKDDPRYIPHFISALEKGFHFVQASRFITGGMGENTPILRYFAVRFVHAPLLSLFSGFHWTDTTQGFRAYSSDLLSDPRISIFRDIFDTYELLAYLSYISPKMGYRCVELPSRRTYPKGKVPTKIKGFRQNVRLLSILMKACLGFYNVR